MWLGCVQNQPPYFHLVTHIYASLTTFLWHEKLEVFVRGSLLCQSKISLEIVSTRIWMREITDTWLWCRPAHGRFAVWPSAQSWGNSSISGCHSLVICLGADSLNLFLNLTHKMKVRLIIRVGSTVNTIYFLEDVNSFWQIIYVHRILLESRWKVV